MSIYPSEYSVAEKVFGIVSNIKVKMNGKAVNNIGMTSKIFTTNEEPKIQIIIHTIQTDLRNKDFVTRNVKKLFSDMLKDIKEQYKLEYGKELVLDDASGVTDAADPIGYGYSNGAAGAFMVNATQKVSRYNLRVFETFTPREK